MSTAPMTTSASATDSSIWRLEDMSSVTRRAEHLLEVPHPVDRALDDRDVRAEPERDHGRVVADHPAADDDDLARARRPARRRAGGPGRRAASRGSRRRPVPRAGRRSRSSARAAAARGCAVSTVSYATAVIPLSISARVRPSSAARWRYVKRTSPSRSRPYSAATGSLTLSRSSTSPQTSSTDTICAPSASYAASGKALPSPAPLLDEHVVARAGSARARRPASARRGIRRT